MKVTVCGNMSYHRNQVKRLVRWAKKHAADVLGPVADQVKELRIVVNKEHGRPTEEWIAAHAFDLVPEPGVVRVNQWQFSLGTGAEAVYFLTHELYHARQQLEGRLYRAADDWSVVFYRAPGARNARRYDHTMFVSRGMTALQRYRDSDGVGRQGVRLPWELEAFREVRKMFPKVHSARWGDWYPR